MMNGARGKHTRIQDKVARDVAALQSTTGRDHSSYLDRQLERASALGIVTIGDLDALLESDRADDTLTAACELATYVGDRRSTSVRLARLLRTSESDSVRWAAHIALFLAGGTNVFRSVAPIARRHPDAEVRELATYVLAMGFDYDAREAADLMLSIFTDLEEDPLVRAQAAEGIGNHATRRRRRRFVPSLLDGLADASPEVRFWSCFALAGLGSAEEIPALQRLRLDRTVVSMGWSVGREARYAIECIREHLGAGPHPAWPEVGELE